MLVKIKWILTRIFKAYFNLKILTRICKLTLVLNVIQTQKISYLKPCVSVLRIVNRWQHPNIFSSKMDSKSSPHIRFYALQLCGSVVQFCHGFDYIVYSWMIVLRNIFISLTILFALLTLNLTVVFSILSIVLGLRFPLLCFWW